MCRFWKTPAVFITRQLKVFRKTVSAETTIGLRRHRTVRELSAPTVSFWLAGHWRIAASAARFHACDYSSKPPCFRQLNVLCPTLRDELRNAAAFPADQSEALHDESLTSRCSLTLSPLLRSATTNGFSWRTFGNSGLSPLPCTCRTVCISRRRKTCPEWKPARVIPRLASSFFMKYCHTKPVRAFSAISSVMPASIPRTSWSYHFVIALNASPKPHV